MLFDYRPILESPGLVVGVLAIILIIKPIAALGIVIIGGHSLKTALTVAGGLAQIGEFSFILGDTAQSLGLIPGSGNSVLVAAAVVSISLNPLIFRRMLALETAACPSPAARGRGWPADVRGSELARTKSAAERMQDPRCDRGSATDRSVKQSRDCSPSSRSPDHRRDQCRGRRGAATAGQTGAFR